MKVLGSSPTLRFTRCDIFPSVHGTVTDMSVCVCLCFQGYTALHLASIHGHQHVVHALINTYSESVYLQKPDVT